MPGGIGRQMCMKCIAERSVILSVGLLVLVAWMVEDEGLQMGGKSDLEDREYI